jgi:hypothetical protein
MTSTKLQINSKTQYSNLKQDHTPIVWSAAGGSVIVICYLKFLIAETPGPDLTL